MGQYLLIYFHIMAIVLSETAIDPNGSVDISDKEILVSRETIGLMVTHVDRSWA